MKKLKANPDMIGKGTPPEVWAAIETLQDYMKTGGWVQAIINTEGGVSFRLTDIHTGYLDPITFDGVPFQWQVELDATDDDIAALQNGRGDR